MWNAIKYEFCKVEFLCWNGDFNWLGWIVFVFFVFVILGILSSMSSN